VHKRNGLGYIISFASEKPIKFKELTARVHDMELIIAYCGRQLNDDELITLSRNRNFMLRHPEENEYPCSEF